MPILTNEQIVSLIDNARSSRTETTNVEFKDARGGIPGDLWRTISSFSHMPNGGIIVFGIKEDRNTGTINVVGGLDLASLQEKVASYFHDKMQNYDTPDLRILEYLAHQLLVLVIKEIPNETKPCFNKTLGLPNGACIRVGNTDRVITMEETRQFIRNSSLYKFDKTPAEDITKEMLSMEKIKLFLEKSAAKTGRVNIDNTVTDGLLKNVGILTQINENYLPTIGGALIFSKDNPQKIKSFTRYVIRCIRYQGVSVSSPIIDKADMGGTLDQQIDGMQKFILRNIPLKAKIVGTKRIESFEYPENAIREIVANSVIHRDYMITETYTQVGIFSNRIEISNAGNLPPGITIDNIKDSQFSRNEIIATILKDLDYLEEYGRGINIVFSLMNEWGLPEPIFKNTANTFKVILLGSEWKNINERQITIWHTLQDKKRITPRECRKLFPGVSRATIATDLRKLVDLGLIVSKGSTVSAYYESQY